MKLTMAISPLRWMLTIVNLCLRAVATIVLICVLCLVLLTARSAGTVEEASDE